MLACAFAHSRNASLHTHARARREEAIRAAEAAAEAERLAEQQRQLEEESLLIRSIEAAGQAHNRKKRADVRKRTVHTVKSLKAAVLAGAAPSLVRNSEQAAALGIIPRF